MQITKFHQLFGRNPARAKGGSFCRVVIDDALNLRDLKRSPFARHMEPTTKLVNMLPVNFEIRRTDFFVAPMDEGTFANVYALCENRPVKICSTTFSTVRKVIEQ